MTCFYPPLRGLLMHLRLRWRNRRACHHTGWTRDADCPCGKW